MSHKLSTPTPQTSFNDALKKVPAEHLPGARGIVGYVLGTLAHDDHDHEALVPADPVHELTTAERQKLQSAPAYKWARLLLRALAGATIDQAVVAAVVGVAAQKKP